MKIHGTLAGNGTKESPYLIESIEDLVFFATDVTNGNEYLGQYVKLENSLNFYADSSYVNPKIKDFAGYKGELKTALTTGEGFKGIGTTVSKEDETIIDNSFCGYFDGNNHVIANSYINVNTSNLDRFNLYGFFGGYLYGEVKNLGVTGINYNMIIKDSPMSMTGILGKLCDNGKLYNCYTSGTITVTANGNANVNVGGIIGYNRGKIENCYNETLIDIKTTQDNSPLNIYCGGIAINNENEEAVITHCYNKGNITALMKSGKSVQIGGVIRANSLGSIEECYNKGTINAFIGKSTDDSYIGGLIGISTNMNKVIKNIYNTGYIIIELEGLRAYVGGIIGRCDGTLENCYNVGNIINKNTQTSCLIGEIAGLASSGAQIDKSFYIRNNAFGKKISNTCNADKISSKQLQDESILNILNSNGVQWKKDLMGKNNGYPILNWQ